MSAIIAPLVYRLLLRLNSRQTVSQYVPEHAAKQGTPTMGGLVIVVGVIAAFLATGEPSNNFALFVFVWYTLIGVLDDFIVPRMVKGKRGLDWMPKLALQILPFVALQLFMPGVPIWVTAVTAFVVLFFANAYNFSDGLDGLSGGLGGVLALTIFACPVLVAALNPTAHVDKTLLPVVFGLGLAFVPFLYFNAPPAKMFMGDAGSLPIGSLLGMGFIQATLFRDPYVPSVERILPFVPCLLVLLIELVPVPLQIASAKLRKGKRMFPFKTPVHHEFQSRGVPETRVVAWFVLTQFVLSLVTVGMSLGLMDSGPVRWSGGP